MFILPVMLHAQVTLNGKATSYRGKELICTHYADYISYETEELGKVKVKEDGSFSFTIPLKRTEQIQLHCDGAKGILYADPYATYSIVVNKPDSTQEYAYRQNIRIDFDTLPKMDINNLILDFNSRHDDFIFYNFTVFGKPVFAQRLDTFKIYLSKVYKEISNEYFIDYVAYSVAETEMLGMQHSDENSFFKIIYASYILKKPIRYENDKYMNFFNKFYSDVFRMVPTSDEMDLFRAINYKGSPSQACSILQKDVLLREKRIAELAMLKSLGQEYYNFEFDKNMIIKMLDSIAESSSFEEHKIIAANIKKHVLHLSKGSQAPEFILKNTTDSIVKLSDFKGKFVYIMFWNTENTHSVNELKILKGLYEKYKWDVEFINIDVGEDKVKMDQFLKKNNYKWTFLHDGDDKSIRDKYNAVTLPQYFLIDPNGILLQAPALGPTPSGNFTSIHETFERIKRKLHPDKKIIPGQKEN